MLAGFLLLACSFLAALIGFVAPISKRACYSWPVVHFEYFRLYRNAKLCDSWVVKQSTKCLGINSELDDKAKRQRIEIKTWNCWDSLSKVTLYRKRAHHNLQLWQPKYLLQIFQMLFHTIPEYRRWNFPFRAQQRNLIFSHMCFPEHDFRNVFSFLISAFAT